MNLKTNGNKMKTLHDFDNLTFNSKNNKGTTIS